MMIGRSNKGEYFNEGYTAYATHRKAQSDNPYPFQGNDGWKARDWEEGWKVAWEDGGDDD